MKKTVILSSVVLFTGFLVAQPPPRGMGWGGGPRGEFGMMSEGPASRTPVTGAPYSATRTTQFQQPLANGNQITRQDQSKVYRDKDGRVRMERTFTPPGSTTSETIISIFDPVAGFSHVLNPTKMTAVKTPLPPARNAQTSASGHARTPRGDNAQVQTESLGTQTINGVAATGTRTTETIAAGAIGNLQALQITREVWVSNDLKVPVMIKGTDPRFGNTVMQLTNIVQTDPDASLFVVPSTYTETTRTGGFGRGGVGGGDRPTRRGPASQ